MNTGLTGKLAALDKNKTQPEKRRASGGRRQCARHQPPIQRW